MTKEPGLAFEAEKNFRSIPVSDGTRLAVGGSGEKTGRLRGVAIGALLAALTFAVYAQTVNFEFVSLDDGLYVYDNPRVKGGLTARGIAWGLGFEGKSQTYWHPVAWLSHMLDVELFGLDAGAHHLTNVFLHFANVLLLFALLRRLGGALWLSAAVAAVFAVHPLNVESVAWVAERKSVLSTAFWMLATHAYIGYVKRPGALRYGVLALVFTLGLLTKPMLVTLPCTLLLLDYWPLGRLAPRSPAGDAEAAVAAPGVAGPGASRRLDLILEKIPLLAISLLVAWLAMGSVGPSNPGSLFEAAPMSVRLQNAAVSSLTYVAKVVWPSDLAMFYPYPQSLPAWQVAGSVLVLAVVSAAAVRMRRTRPYLIVGWLWFLGTLVPVSGVVQAGQWPAWADRWAYVPSIGLLVMMVWGAGDLLRRAGPKARPPAAALALLGLLSLAYAGHRQAAVWKDDVALYRNAIEKVPDNFFACSNLAEALYRQGRFEEAEGLFAKSLSIAPLYVPAHIGMANTMLDSGHVGKAFSHYREALKLSPHEKTALNNLGVLYLQTGQSREAIDAFQQALAIDMEYAEAHNNIGFAYLKAGRAPEAARHLKRALALNPGNRMARENMQELLGGRPPE